MNPLVGAIAILSALPLGAVSAQEATPPPAPSRSAPRLVREANELLLGDKAAEALEAYNQAQQLRPDSREIAFDQGLARYKLGEFDEARDAFNRASTGASDALADDAVYGLGAVDHAKALAASDPKEAISHVENAMRNYQTVLGNHPDHAAARTANLKAASYWRQLKQQMEQQQQQQQQDKDQNQDSDKGSEPQQRPKPNQSVQAPDEREKAEGSPEHQDTPEGQEQPVEAQENQTQEQAERKLREMMQAMRDRKKQRKEDANPPSFRPAEKDW